MLLAVDPGQNSPGVALYREGANQLVAAGRVPIPEEWVEREPGQRWLDVALEIAAWIQAQQMQRYQIRHVVFEKPQWYQRGKSKTDPNKLAGVLAVACNLTGYLAQYGRFEVKTPEPAAWIGQLSKECPDCKYRRGALKGTGVRTLSKNCKNCRGSAWETPRGRYIRKRLQPAELALVPDQNDAIDAVGIGLWALGRLTPYQVFSNGRDGR